MSVHQGASSGTIHLTLRTLTLAPAPIKDIGAVPCRGLRPHQRSSSLFFLVEARLVQAQTGLYHHK
ncbi:hypothetical protein Taro_046496 [Colocasia esculenta]|uniref:Uncharacterized protein n=1 Tax=Colocasia esculenta TaxID=4460 RepID=A0A843WTY0_COLES|nr:hypothetical protein [Colocasia esculenta]